MTEEFQKMALTRIENSATRLATLIKQKAPSVIIANEIAMITQRAAGLWGADVFKFIAKAVARHERWRLGFCMEDDCGKKLETKNELIEGLCQLHINKLMEEMGENYEPRHQEDV